MQKLVHVSNIWQYQIRKHYLSTWVRKKCVGLLTAMETNR